MAGFDRYNNMLKLFLSEGTSWTVAEIAEALETSPSNVYRTVRELVEAGFLESTRESRYRLGPTFLEFEHRLRETDPLVRSGGVFLRTLVGTGGPALCCGAGPPVRQTRDVCGRGTYIGSAHQL